MTFTECHDKHFKNVDSEHLDCGGDMKQLIMVPLDGKQGCGKTSTLNRLAEFFIKGSFHYKDGVFDCEMIDQKKANEDGDFNYAFSLDCGNMIVIITTSGDSDVEVKSNTKFFEQIVSIIPNANKYYWFLACHTRKESFDAVSAKESEFMQLKDNSNLQVTDRYWFYKDRIWFHRQDDTDLSKDFYDFMNNSCAEDLFRLFLEIKDRR